MIWHVIELIAISLDHELMCIEGGFNGGFNNGSFDQFHLAVLGYRPQWSVQQLRWEDFTAISWEGFMGYYNSDKPSYRGSSPFVIVENVLKE
jgi:hypothetical protein